MMLFGLLPFFFVLWSIFVHVKVLRSQKKSPRQRESLSPKEYTDPALPEKPGLESSL